MVICRISRTDAPVTEQRILVPRQGSECRMFTAEQYREKAASWFVPPLVIPIAFAIIWVGSSGHSHERPAHQAFA
jgi:hypothetical protein